MRDTKPIQIMKNVLFTLVYFLFISSFSLSGLVKPGKISNFTELEVAIKLLQKQVSASAANADTYNQLAGLLQSTGRIAEAEQMLQKALSKNPAHLPSLISLSKLYKRQYRFDEGLYFLGKVTGLAPQNRQVRLLEAEYAAAKMDFNLAKTIYQELMRDEPRSSECLYGLAEIHYWENRFPEAEACEGADSAFMRASLAARTRASTRSSMSPSMASSSL